MKQTTLFDTQVVLIQQQHLRDLRGRFATREQREFTIREQRVRSVEIENTRLKLTIESQRRLIEAQRLRMLQLFDEIRRNKTVSDLNGTRTVQPSASVQKRPQTKEEDTNQAIQTTP